MRRSTLLLAGLGSGCLGGQSGGETGHQDDKADSPAPCACMPVGSRPVRARITGLAAGCATLEVLEVLVEPTADEYMPLQVGDVFGGSLQPLCQESPDVVQGDEVLALFSRGAQTSSACPEYRACSSARCGNPDAAYTTSIDPECKAEQQKNPAIDCEPIQQVDNDALVAYDVCDSQCLEENRDVCASHVSDEQLGGRVSVAKWVDGEVYFYWAAQQRHEPFAQLQSAECTQRHKQLWDERPRSSHSKTTQTAAEAPEDQAAAPVCPLK